MLHTNIGIYNTLFNLVINELPNRDNIMSSPTIQSSETIKKNKKIDKSKIKPRTRRRNQHYTREYKDEMKDGANAAVYELQKEEKKTKRKTGKDYLYTPQIETAEKIFNEFLVPSLLAVFVFALTQSGKTGLMIAIIKLWAEKCRDGVKYIEMENIYIITGLSDKNWKEQTLERMPGFLKENIFHRGGLNRKKNSFWKAIEGKKNCLILIDEVQIASTGTTIKKAFKKCGILDIKYCFENNIKIVEVTATPDGIGIDLAKEEEKGGWPKKNYLYLSMQADEGHTSQFTYLDTLDDPNKQTRLYQYKNLVNYSSKSQTYDDAKSEQNIREIKQTYHTHFDNQSKYILIRVNTQHGEKTKENLKKVFHVSECNYLEYNSKIKKRDWPQWNGPDDEADFRVDINKDLLDIEPEKLTIVLVKDMLRAAKTLTKHHIGIVYERAAKKDNDSAQIQGLPGRVTGYGVPDNIAVFTNIDTIRRYKKIHKEDGNIAQANVQWNSTSSTTNSQGKVAARGRTWHAAMKKSKRKQQVKENHTVFNVYITQEEAREYIKEGVIKKYNIMMPKNPTKLKQGARKKEKEKDGKYQGFYIASLEDRKNGKKETMVPRLLSEVEKFQKGSQRTLGKKNEWKMRPCYHDLEDKTTLVWTVAHLDYNPNTK